MAYRDDRSLEELIAGSIENKKKTKKINVVKANTREQTGEFRVNIDYSKSDSSFYENYDRSEKAYGKAKTSQMPGLDPEFLQSLRDNFGTNAQNNYGKRKSSKREYTLNIQDTAEDSYDDYGDYYDSEADIYNSSGGYSYQSGKTVRAKVKPVSRTANVRESGFSASKSRNLTKENRPNQRSYPKSDKNTYNKNINYQNKKKNEKEIARMKYKDNPKISEPVKKKKKHIFSIIFIVIIIFILLLFGLVYYFIDKYSGLFNYVPTGNRLNIENVYSDKGVFNILLIGTDARGSSNGLSDSVILVSINKDTKQIVMSSFMRDTYVEIPGQEQETWHKLNWAHSHGGAELLMDTLEYNFGIEIDYYARVDFMAFANIIDAVGGLDIEITDAEAVAMQSPMAEQNNIFGNPWGTDYLYEGGSYHMNGNQALAYSRIRKGVGDDFARTDRQREVIGLIADKAKAMSVTELDELAETVIPNITTNMDKSTIKSLMTKIPGYLGYERISQRIPYGDDMESWSYGSSADGSIIVADFELNKQKLMETIYNQ